MINGLSGDLKGFMAELENKDLFSINSYRFGLHLTMWAFILFGVIDTLVIDDKEALHLTWVVRFGLIVPMYGFMLVFSKHRNFLALHNKLSTLFAFLLTSGVLALVTIALEFNQPNFYIYFVALLMVVSFAPLVLWLNVLGSSLYALGSVASFIVVVGGFLNSWFTYRELVAYSAILLVAAVIGVYIRIAFLILHANNISKKQLLEEEKFKLEEVKQRLIVSNSTQQRVLAVLTHDVRSPLNNISSMLDLMGNGYISTEEFNKYMKEIRATISGTKVLIEDVLTWVDVDHGMKTGSTLCNGARLVNETFQLLAHSAESKGIYLINDVPESIWFDSRPDILRFVFRNLISNAIKFTDIGYVRVKGQWLAEQQMEFVVEDSGVGISSENIQRLFNSNQRFSANGTQNEKGKGLGLLLCKEILTQVSGKITYELGPAGGSVFRFTLFAKPNVTLTAEFLAAESARSRLN